MAIQEIEKSASTGTEGHKKTIDEGAQNMIFDILQNTQYQKPEESTVRELASNAVDSQKEKEIAIEILRDGVDPSEYYLQREGLKYKDSNWSPDYYDLNHLDMENNHVQLTYKEVDGTGFCDQFVVKDYGVGISGSRLEGILSLGYSTKRNTKAALGAWGLGAKVALSLNGDYYTLTTVHNGKKFIANCYSYKTDFMVGKFNMKESTENEFITFSDGTSVYYEETTEKNYTEITVRCKRHHRTKFRRAVESQLLYFPNVKFTHVGQDDYRSDIPFLAKILYNSSNIIISDNTQFSKPHVVIVKGDDDADSTTGVCYGYIDFTELEMENLNGNIGVKCPIRSVIRDDMTGEETVLREGVSVTPSRESVIWDDHTRDFLKAQFAKVVDEANDLVTEELKEQDFLRWIGKCKTLISNMDRTSVLGRMSKVVDTFKIKPKYPLDKTIKYEIMARMLWGFRVRLVDKTYDRKKDKDKVSRNLIESWGSFRADRVFFKEESTSVARDMYLVNEGGPFIMLEEINDIDDLTKDIKEGDEKEALIQKHLDKRALVKKWILASEDIANYDEVEVPEDWAAQFDDVDEESGDFIEMSHEDRRLLQDRIVITTPESRGRYGREIAFAKKEPQVKELADTELDVYYGTSEDNEKLIHAFEVGKSQHEHPTYHGYSAGYGFYEETAPFKLLKISKSNLKHVSRFKHINKFFQTLTSNNLITMDPKLVQWHTGRLISDHLPNLIFFRNFKSFNEQMQEDYQTLQNYYSKHYSSLYNIDEASVEEYFDKVLEMQLFVRDGDADAEAVKAKSRELFIIDDVVDGLGVDIGIYDTLQKLVEYAEPIAPLFNSIKFLCDAAADISPDQQILIREILTAKNREFI